MIVRRSGMDAVALLRCLRAVVLGVLACTALVNVNAAAAAGVTNSGSDLRDGWYGDQPDLGPDVVGGGTFGQLWSHQIYGQVYAQPLVHEGRVIVVTESNWVYSLDAETGAERWSYHLPGVTWKPDDAPCWDLYPEIGATATPVIDSATDTIYFTHKVYASGSSGAAKLYLDALDANTGAIRAGFPVELQGTAQNAPRTFSPTMQMQRPGLLLMDGVVYAGIGSVCDASPWQGWIFGVTTNGTIRARFVTLSTPWTDGAGIWQAGSGIMSDGPGRMFVSTGNGGAPTGTIPGSTPPGDLGESVVRLDVQPDGSLKAKDFFAPYDASTLDTWDADFASGGVTGLRDDVFGTASVPHVALAVGKSGYLYLLNRDDLGGIGTGANRGDRVLQRLGPRGGVWSRPGAWPGNGGYVYVPTASGGTTAQGSSGLLDVYKNAPTASGTPALTRVAQSADSFGFGSSSPVVTSDGKTSGSALVWTVWMAKGDGKNAQLRAYDAVPQNGIVALRKSWPIAEASKFNPPGVGNGRVYVGTRDGHVLAFGAPVTTKVTGGSTTFPTTTIGQTTTTAVTLKATGHVTISAIDASPSVFAAATSGLGLPKTLEAGGTLTVPLSFAPEAVGPVGGTLTVTTDQGTFTFTLTGTGQAAAAKLGCLSTVISFEGVVVGQTRSDTIALCNEGGQPLTISSVDLPSAPFSLSDVPTTGHVVAPGDSLTIPVAFAPTTAGTATSEVVVHTSAGDAAVGLTGTAALGPKLTISATALDFGAVTAPGGTPAVRSFTVSNTGDTPLHVTKSKPPALGEFVALDALDEGSTLAPGASRTLRVRFAPSSPGAKADGWVLNGDDTTGVRTVALAGTGTSPLTPTATPASASFEPTLVGATRDQTIAFANPGDTPVTVTGLRATGPYDVVGSPPATLAAGATFSATVRFAPVAAGVATGALVLDTSAGSATATLTGDGRAGPRLEVDRVAVDLGDVVLGQTATAAFTVTNAGDLDLTLSTAVALAGPFWAVDPLTAPATLVPGASRPLGVTFAPTAAGPQTSAWTLATNDATAPSRTLTVFGRGVAPAEEPPSGDPPSGNPPSGNPPSGNPPATTPAPTTDPSSTTPPGEPGALVGQAPGPDLRAAARLRLTRARLTHGGHRLRVTGTVNVAATGHLRVVLSAAVRGATVRATTWTVPRGGRFAATLVVPKPLRGRRSATLQVDVQANDRVRAQAVRHVVRLR